MAHKEYVVSVLPMAEEKLATHLQFLTAVSESAAQKLYQSYRDALAFIATNPESCPLYLPSPSYRYKLFGKRYRIVFQIVESTVYADDIQDCRQDEDKNLI